MKAFTLILITAILFELVAAGLYLRHQAAMTIPLLPKEHLADATITPQLEKLADAAQSGNSEDWKRLAEGLLGKGFYSHAELAFRESLRRDPANFDAKFGLAYCLDRTGRIEQSSVAYSDVVQGAAKSPEEQAIQIYSLYAMGRNALRIEDEQSAHKLFLQNADYPAAEYQQAKLWVRSGEAEKALPLIRKNLEKIPYSLGYHFLDQRAQEALGNEREAFMAKAMVERSAYLVSLNFGTDYVSPLNARTGIDALVAELMVAVDAEDWDKAEGICQDINNAVGETPVFVANPTNDAMLQVFLHRQQPQKVLDLVEKLKAAGRVDAVTLEAAGDAYLILNDPPNALESWQRALKLKPSVSLHQKLANNLSEGKEFHLSQVAFRRGLEHYRRNRLRAAIPEFQKSIELAPQTAMAWFYLGEMYYHLDKPTEALEAFQQCLNLEPQHGRAADKVKFLTHKD